MGLDFSQGSDEPVTVAIDAVARCERSVAKAQCASGCALAGVATPSRNRVEREHGDVHAAERIHVAYRTVYHDAGPAVLRCEMRHPVAEDRDPARATAVDHQHAALARLFERAPNQRRVFEGLDSCNTASQPWLAAEAEERRMANLHRIAMQIAKICGFEGCHGLSWLGA